LGKKLDFIGINQLPVSATRRQQESQICFATFMLWKIVLIATTEVREKINAGVE
jgi:hypothetical protein